MGLIRGPLVDLQHVLHRTDKLGIGFRWNTPLRFQPRLQFVFFNTCRTVSYDTVSTYSSSTIRSANSRKVHRFRPSGGALHATAIKCASCTPSSFGLW